MAKAVRNNHGRLCARPADARRVLTEPCIKVGFGSNDPSYLIGMQQDGSTMATYAYNALNQRTQKVVNGTTTRFVYDEHSQLLGEYGTLSREYVWLDDLPVGVIGTSGTTHTVNYIHADGLNTPRAIADSAGTTIWQWPYQGNAFGEEPPTSSTGYVLNLRFPGQYHDAESGLAYNVHRDYDAATGRYIQSDPIGLRGGMTTFAYVGGNPLSYIDPYGLDSLMLGGSVSAIAVGGFTLSAGLYVSWGKDGFDTGFYGSAGMGVGVNIGAGVVGTYVPGSWKNISGTSLDASAGYGPITVTGSASPTDDGCKKGVNSSGSVGVGLGLPAAGSLTATKTGSVGWQDFTNFVHGHF